MISRLPKVNLQSLYYTIPIRRLILYSISLIENWKKKRKIETKKEDLSSQMHLLETD